MHISDRQLVSMLFSRMVQTSGPPRTGSYDVDRDATAFVRSKCWVWFDSDPRGEPVITTAADGMPVGSAPPGPAAYELRYDDSTWGILITAHDSQYGEHRRDVLGRVYLPMTEETFSECTEQDRMFLLLALTEGVWSRKEPRPSEEEQYAGMMEVG